MTGDDYLTLEHVNAAYEHISALIGDPEAAHSTEDKLHRNVLQAIADGKCADPQACAKRALDTLQLNFARWCA